MAHEDANRDYYDDFAGWYDRGRGAGYHRMIDELEIEAVRDLARDADVLEAGCGTGLVLSKLAPLARSAKGFDLSPGMLEKARARGLDVVLGSVTNIPFPDASFDLVCSFKVLAHVPEIGRALAEIARVTRPGGTMALELYNPWSLRYVAKRLGGPQKISEGRTEADVYTRWDAPTTVPKILPPGVEVIGHAGVRVLTPAAFVHRIPAVGSALRIAERAALRSPLRYFGGFLVVLLRKTR